MTPEAPAQKILCDKFDVCGKVYKSRARMLTHMKAVHKDTLDNRTSLDSPIRLALFQLQEGEEAEARTQGDSNGQINSPKVVSKGTFLCSVCDEEFAQNEEALKHIADNHGPEPVAATAEIEEEDMTGDEDALEQACELYEALEAMTLEINNAEAPESKEEIVSKLERFKILVEKKTQIQKDTSHEVKLLRQVETEQMKAIEKRDKEISLLKKSATKEKERFQKDLGTLQSKLNGVVKSNNTLEAKLKEKEAVSQSLEDQSDENSEDISVVEEVVTMRNNTSGHTCTICNKRFNTNDDLEKHIKEKHTESECPFCCLMFSNNNKLKHHINNCIQNETANVKCNNCNQTFTNSGIKRHNPQCHNKKEVVCKECGMIANSKDEIKKHMDKEHKAWQEKSQEVCFHFRNGFCFRGDSCRFAHVGTQRRNTSKPTSRPDTVSNWTPACNKGNGCSWLARGACKFFHRGVGVQKPNLTQQRPNQTGRRQEGRQSFSYNSRSDFPPMRRGNQQMRRNTGRN